MSVRPLRCTARALFSMRIERAILSVSDKSGIIELAKALKAQGAEILSTGGTAKHLADAGIEVTPIASWSGAPEILGCWQLVAGKYNIGKYTRFGYKCVETGQYVCRSK